ncbi:hypothetical protein L202_01631 [Cryptococcus amylolentus CBS 6039]|uniref:Major facilitator superfamily (MFS) profile domain-containing protein n=2 Tax=Cryptococcus amylolentus TaxID=104669 RepID=A0A1E3I4P8_9TREE|nr:hypothetical protein L202_01631 [Cryptococcus amylolentus CBS 6039]ODN83497.1 hypothetical protein L202_01631 [Cryptococcus amylolentus CBS 6039]ODO11012.1 hypothetical protein I350_01612 [Cryptococcus amylolentus CBS 6273]
MGALQRARQRSKVVDVVVDVFDWYPAHYPKQERKLLRKMDIGILIFGCLSFFCKYLDQTNITNAYVSGMEEDIGATGNDLNYFNVAYFTAYVIGQIPLIALQSKPALAPYLLPTMEVIWAILTFVQCRVTKPWHLYILRALLGFFSAPSFGGTHLVLGSWYRKEELFKRAGVWFTGNALGSACGGYIQAAAYKNLEGVGGMRGWRWLFVINGIVTLPVAAIGFALFPGLVNSPRRWWCTEEEYELARTRLSKDHGADQGVTWQTIKDVLRKPMIWICVPSYIFLCQASYWTGYMSLWLKRDTNYSVELINILPTFLYLIQAIASWVGTTLAGALSTRVLWTFQAFAIIFPTILLCIWNIPNGLKFFAFYFSGFHYMASPIFYSWINDTLRSSPAERGLIISACMTLGYTFYIWVPLFTFPTVEAPRYPHGYPPSIVFAAALYLLVLFGMWYMEKHPAVPEVQEGDIERRSQESEQEGARTPGSEYEDEKDASEVGSKEIKGTVVLGREAEAFTSVGVQTAKIGA